MVKVNEQNKGFIELLKTKKSVRIISQKQHGFSKYVILMIHYKVVKKYINSSGSTWKCWYIVY